MKSDDIFYTRGSRYGSIKLKFSNKEIAVKQATKAIRNLKWVLFPTYLE